MTRPVLESTAVAEASALVVQNLSLQLGRSPRRLLQDLSFVLRPGEVTALLGSSGSGKSLLLQVLAGLKTASQGQILWQGQALSSFAPVALRRQIAWMPQQPRLLGMKVGEAIAYPLKLQGLNSSEIQQRMEVWLGLLGFPLDWLDLPSERLPPEVAQGVALARALVMQPNLLLLDNPWPQPPADPWGAVQQGEAGEEVFNGGSAQSYPLWQEPWDSIEKALNTVAQQGGSVLWATKGKIAIAQRLLPLEQGQLQSDGPATPATWKQAMAQLKACESAKLLDSTEDDEWD